MPNLHKLALRFVSMLPKSLHGESLPLPRFLVVNLPLAPWLGQCVFDGKEIIVRLQKRILEDSETLDRVIGHEMAHAFAYWKCYVLNELPISQADGHSSAGAWFRAAGMINSHEGQDFVTEKSDETYVEYAEKAFYVFLEVSATDLAWSWFGQLNDVVERALRYRIAHNDMHQIRCAIVKTSDARFMIPAAKLPSAGRLVDMPEDMIEKIHKAVQQNPLTMDSLRDIRSLTTQARLI